MSHQSVYRIDRHRPPGESLSQPFELGPCSVLQGVLPDNGLRGYRTRSAICLPVCELAFVIVLSRGAATGAGSLQHDRKPERCFLRRALEKEGNQTHAVQIESVTANRIAQFLTSKDAACVANFQ